MVSLGAGRVDGAAVDEETAVVIGRHTGQCCASTDRASKSAHPVSRCVHDQSESTIDRSIKSDILPGHGGVRAEVNRAIEGLVAGGGDACVQVDGLRGNGDGPGDVGRKTGDVHGVSGRAGSGRDHVQTGDCRGQNPHSAGVGTGHVGSTEVGGAQDGVRIGDHVVGAVKGDGNGISRFGSDVGDGQYTASEVHIGVRSSGEENHVVAGAAHIGDDKILSARSYGGALWQTGEGSRDRIRGIIVNDDEGVACGGCKIVGQLQSTTKGYSAGHIDLVIARINRGVVELHGIE